MRPRRPAGFAAGLLAAALLAACGSGSGGDLGNGLAAGSGAPGTDGRIAVVAGENVWGDILRQLGGDRVSVTSIIKDPNADPHEYETSVSDAAAVAHARLVVLNGAGYDEFLNRLVNAAHVSGRTQLTVSDIVDVHGSNPNPHLWYSPTYVIEAAHAFEQALVAIAPSDSSIFSANLAQFLAGEQEVTAVIDQIASRHAGASVGYTERVAGYLLAAAGLTVGTPTGFSQAIENGDDPSPVDNLNFESAITDHRITVLIYNSQVTDTITAQLKTLAASSHVPVVGMSETLPPDDHDYQTWQADQARALLEALGG
jgi:zinc/manganese transport system substrate-binding protein